MSLRRGETARLKATGPTATATSPGQVELVGRRWSR
jgi:hypothetical protein